MDTIYLIDNSFIFNPSAHTLQKIEGSETINLAISASLCLTLLIENQGEVTLRHELLNQVWGSRGMNVTTNTLYQNISLLRKAFTRAGIDISMIQTVPRRGFLFDRNVDIKKQVGERRPTKLIDTSDVYNARSTEIYQTVNYASNLTLSKEDNAKLTIKCYKKIAIGSISIFLFIMIFITAYASKLDSLPETYDRFISKNSCVKNINQSSAIANGYDKNTANSDFKCGQRNTTSKLIHHPVSHPDSVLCQYPITLSHWSECAPSVYF